MKNKYSNNENSFPKPKNPPLKRSKINVDTSTSSKMNKGFDPVVEVSNPPLEPPAPANEKKNAINLIINGILFIAIIAMLYAVYKYWGLFHLPELSTMPGGAVLFFALSIAFVWVDVMHWGYKKPFNCVKCMSGWFAMVLAYVFNTEFWYLYLFAGVFVGALFSGIKIRYL